MMNCLLCASKKTLLDLNFTYEDRSKMYGPQNTIIQYENVFFSKKIDQVSLEYYPVMLHFPDNNAVMLFSSEPSILIYQDMGKTLSLAEWFHDPKFKWIHQYLTEMIQIGSLISPAYRYLSYYQHALSMINLEKVSKSPSGLTTITIQQKVDQDKKDLLLAMELYGLISSDFVSDF